MKGRSRLGTVATEGLVSALLAAGLVVAPLRGQEPGERRVVEVPGTSQTLTLAWVPGGVFRMGSPPDEADRGDDEGPAGDVRLDGFWMTVHEITYDQYAPFRFRAFDTDQGAGPPGTFRADAVTRPSPPYEDPTHGMGQGEHPATGMTRLNALRYARWLSLKTGYLFRLPTEAEWERACRAGGEGPRGGLDAETLPAAAWFDANGGDVLHPVGGKAPNPLGLHDLLGNAAEWTLDGYEADYFARLTENPLAGEVTRGRGVVRGGSFRDPAEALRCAAREAETPEWKRRDPQIPKSRWWNTDSPHVGFRLVSTGAERTPDEIRAWFAELLGEG